MAEFYSSNRSDIESMSRVLYSTTTINSNTDILQALVVGVETEFIEREFSKEDILKAYKDLGLILLDLHSKLGGHCLMICDKDEEPLAGYFLCEVKYIRSSTAIVSVGVFEENHDERGR